jgi:hypothetical protein
MGFLPQRPICLRILSFILEKDKAFQGNPSPLNDLLAQVKVSKKSPDR